MAHIPKLGKSRESVKGGYAIVQVLESLLLDAQQLAESVHSTSELSERVSFKVRELDTAQSRIDDTLQRISIVVDRTNAIEGTRGALDVGDYETAAEHVSKYLELEKRFGTIAKDTENRQLQEQRRVRPASSAVHAVILSHSAKACNLILRHDPQNVLRDHWVLCVLWQVIEEAKSRLRHEILARLEEAKQKGDHKTVLRFTRLYAPLGLKV